MKTTYINNLTNVTKRASKYAAFVVMILVATDVLAGGGGTIGDAANRATANVSPLALLFAAIFGVGGFALAGMGIWGFFKKGEPVNVGKQLGLIFAGALLMGLTWVISTVSTSVAGSDQTSTMQDTILVE